MKYGKLVFAKKDHELLETILINRTSSTELTRENYELLLSELNDVLIFDDHTKPKDVVGFHSYVDIETPFGMYKDYEVVVPFKRDPVNKKLSVLSPIGSAIIGYAEGDEVSWNFPAGKQKIKILRVKNETS